jgi:hypothetical protein
MRRVLAGRVPLRKLWVLGLALLTLAPGAGAQTECQATAKPKPGRPKSYTFAYKAPAKTFNLKLSFRKSQVEKQEVIAALESILDDLRRD